MDENKPKAIDHIVTGFWVAIGGFLFSLALTGTKKVLDRE